MPLQAALHEVAARVFEYYRRRPKLSRVLLKESLFAEGPWSQRFVNQVSGVHQRIVELAQRAPELKRGVAPMMIATAWFSFFYFSLIGWVQGSVSDPIALVDQLFQQHLEGLRRRR